MNQESNQKQSTEELLEAAKQEFLAVMSHELRTPMTGVKGYLSMVLDGDAGTISDDVRTYISSAYVANDRLIRLVDHIQKVVTIQEGHLKLNIKKVNLTQTVQISVNDFQQPAKEKHLELVYKMPSDPIFVTADPDRLREVILNLISNAIKFTEQGTITIAHRVVDGHLATVDIQDTGIGIAKEHQGRIFNIFAKANLTLANQEKGTGVGLFLATKLAEAQGGKVWLEKSEPGLGSTFSAAFPLA